MITPFNYPEGDKLPNIRLYSLECNLNQQNACKQFNHWLIIGDKNGLSEASHFLGTLHLYGHNGLKQDVDKAIKAFENAYNTHTDKSGLAAMQLADIYTYYSTFTQAKKSNDYTKAKAWLQKAKAEKYLAQDMIDERIAYIDTLKKADYALDKDPYSY